MKKGVVWSFVIALVLSGTSGFAQGRVGKQALQNIKNMGKLKGIKTVGENTFLNRFPVSPISRVPEGILPKKEHNFVVLEVPISDKIGSPVSASYLNLLRKIMHKAKEEGFSYSKFDTQGTMVYEWGVSYKGKPSIGKAFYDDQSVLARDLDTYYAGEGASVIAPGAKAAKLYALPANNILYKPAGYSVPIVLTAEEYFVVYYPETKTGQIVENTPEMRQFFSKDGNLSPKEVKTAPKTPASIVEKASENVEKPRNIGREAAPEEIVELKRLNEEALQETKEENSSFDGVSRLATSEEIYHLNKQLYLSEEIGMRAAEMVWKQLQYPTLFDSHRELGQTLQRFHKGVGAKVKDLSTGTISEVYEIPVEGLKYKVGGVAYERLTPSNTLVLYNEKTGGQLIDRELIEKQIGFEFVE